jgi:hypothetical protein
MPHGEISRTAYLYQLAMIESGNLVFRLYRTPHAHVRLGSFATKMPCPL